MPLTPEQQVAKQLLQNMEALNKSVATLTDDLESLKKSSEGWKGLDVGETIKEFEKQRAWFEQVKKTIQKSRHGMHFSGIEDCADDFSLIKAMCAIRTGDWGGAGFEKEVLDEAREKASQSVEIGDRGGFFVPEQVIPEIIPAVYANSALISLDDDGTTLCSVIDGMTTETAKIAKFSGGVLSYWVGEEENITESMASVGDVDIRLKKLAALVRLTDAMRRFASFGFEQLLRRDMVKSLALKLDWTILYGTGTDNMPRGIFNNPDVAQFSAESGKVITADPADAGGGELDFDHLDEMIGHNEDNNYGTTPNSAFVGAPRYFRRVKQTKIAHYSGQSTERAYLMGLPRIPDSALEEVIGRFVKTTQVATANVPGKSWGHPTTTTDQFYGDVAYGNWDDVVVARAVALDIEDDRGFHKFPSDHWYLKAKIYVDVGYRRPESIVACADAKMRDS